MRTLILTLGILIFLAAKGMAQDADMKPGEWKVINGEQAVVLLLLADKPVKTSNGPKTPFIALAYPHRQEDPTAVYLYLHHKFQDPELPLPQSELSLRWDKEPVTGELWKFNGELKRASSSSPEKFLQRLGQHSRLTIVGMGDENAPITIEFTLGNFKEAAAAVPKNKKPAAPAPPQNTSPPASGARKGKAAGFELLGNWVVFNGDQAIILNLPSDEPVETLNGLARPNLRMTFSQGDEAPSVSLTLPSLLFLSPAIPDRSVFAMRWGKEPATAEAWKTIADIADSPGTKTIFSPSPAELLKRLQQHSRLTLEGMSDDGAPIAIEFTPGNFRDEVAAALPKVAAALSKIKKPTAAAPTQKAASLTPGADKLKPGQWATLPHGDLATSLVLEADKLVETRNGVKRPSIVMSFMHHEEKMGASLGLFHLFLNPGIPERSVFAMRWDNEPATVEAWTFIADKKTVISPSSGEFLQRLQRHSRLTIEGVGDDGVPIAIEFTLGNFKEVLAGTPKIKRPASGQAGF